MAEPHPRHILALVLMACVALAEASCVTQPEEEDTYALDMSAPPPSQVPQPLPQTAPPSAQQLNQLVAPIALYPDELVAQVLTAATYPAEIVEADRWLQDPANAALRGDELSAALDAQPWDPSVKSLVPFPQVLHMMDSNLSWTEQLGDAFLAQQDQVMDSVQRLRQRAQTAGGLQSNAQQVVDDQDGAVTIEPTTAHT